MLLLLQKLIWELEKLKIYLNKKEELFMFEKIKEKITENRIRQE